MRRRTCCKCGYDEIYEEIVNDLDYDFLLEEIQKRTSNPYSLKKFICDYLEVGYHIHTKEELLQKLKDKL